MALLAHSAQPKKGLPEQSYREHIIGVYQRAQSNVQEMVNYAKQDTLKVALMPIVSWAACYHDLGKLDEDNQQVLQGKINARHLPVNHVDAGVAYLKEIEKKLEAAMLVYSHHRGLPSVADEINRPFPFRDSEIREETDENLSQYLSLHKNEISVKLDQSRQITIADGLTRRLVLSCLVDADYGDSSHYNRREYHLRWEERLNRLDAYVRQSYEENKKNERNDIRNDIYFACKNNDAHSSIYYCDSPVGTGKTTAIMAHLLQTAIKKKLRHIIVVLPYTNIIRQSVQIYRQALVLDYEDPEAIVAEHDHQADFSSFESRELASLWNAPIIVTTAVQFFETLGSNNPSRLRKLHELSGTGIFIDESHAAIPTWLWPQEWNWLLKLTQEWGVHLVLASGTTARFWEIPDFIHNKDYIPELIPEELRVKAYEYEQSRVLLKYSLDTLNPKAPVTFDSIEDLIGFILSKDGPRIVIMNTVFSAAYLAYQMQQQGLDVIHLSTALTPKDREPLIEQIYERLERDEKNKLLYNPNWTLVATSCAEAGLNFSFRNGFAELRSIYSFLQINGRVNREGEYTDSEMWCFMINDSNIKHHPGFKTSQKIFKQLIECDLIGKLSITELITEAIKRELKEDYDEKIERIQKYERNHEYPEVASMCKVIDADTKLVVMNTDIINLLENGEKISSIQLIKNSVQIWMSKVNELNLLPIKGYEDIFKWYDGGYDSKFLGYMKAILFNDSIKNQVLIL